jgi:hypothetical protein
VYEKILCPEPFFLSFFNFFFLSLLFFFFFASSLWYSISWIRKATNARVGILIFWPFPSCLGLPQAPEFAQQKL